MIVAEVTHSIFYAPMYVAIEKGYFKDNGINLNLILTPGADKVSAAVLSGDADIGFAGCTGVPAGFGKLFRSDNSKQSCQECHSRTLDIS